MKKILIGLNLSFFIVSIIFIAIYYYYLLKKTSKRNLVFKTKAISEKNLKIKEEKLTIEKIFQKLPKKDFVLEKKDNKIYLIATGDIIPARSVNYIMTKLNDFAHPLKKTSNFLIQGDLAVINLESPLVDNCPITIEGMIFCTHPNFIDGLKTINKNLIINIANNHFEDYGEENSKKTINLLNKNNFLTFGNEKEAIIKIKNKIFGFLGFNFIAGGKIIKDEEIKKMILDLRKKVDFVIISYHWGDEYTNLPNEKQKFYGILAIDNGADLVIGNHPHWIQAMEIYKNKPIIYSHGNFIFDQMWSEKTRQGIIALYVFEEKKIADIYFYPIIIENYNQPRFADENEAKKILEEMYNNSKKIKN
ncbi:MAG: CapA family protein [Patescibacteria group bacterium]|nr:CapA family protein [Patescibacteria group bacterium]